MIVQMKLSKFSAVIVKKGRVECYVTRKICLILYTLFIPIPFFILYHYTLYTHTL